ncbi:MAG: hypothetical protein U0990_01190 [Candidatus Nanopelagicales bacterium]|nr:hypothetical protein [Candidatus Nanopelagicales bacterium]MDZ4248688.1 hypothetical protein [Candidatus Nanopelagicales bacterium]
MRSPRSTRGLVTLAAAIVTASSAIAAQAPASADIVIGDGLAGVSLGMTPAQVRGVLGKPKRVVKGTNEFGRYRVFRYPHKVRITIMGRSVITTWTTGRYERTATGVGVGSTARQVRAGVPGVVCEKIAGIRYCHVGDYNPGETVTEFKIKHRVVKRALVGRVID